MAQKVGSLIIGLGLESGSFTSGLERSRRSARTTAQGMKRDFGEISAAAGRTNSGMQQLSFQLNDVATQWASGTKPMQIFAQQSGQVVQAIALMSNGATKFGAFMSGPWGAALTAGIVVLSALIPKLFETTEALDKVKFASNAVGDAQGILGSVMDLTTGKINTQNQALIALARAQLIVARIQSQMRQAEAKSQITAAGGAQLGTMMGFSNGQKNPAIEQIRSDFLNGVNTADEAIRRVNAYQAKFKGKMAELSQTEYATLISAFANFGVEAANQDIYKQAEGALNGAGLPASLRKSAGGRDKSARSKSGTSQAEIDRRFADETAGIMRQYNDARASMALSASEQAEFELRNVELARIRTEAQIKADKDYSVAQKQELMARLDELTEEQRRKIEFDLKRRTEEETGRLVQQEFEAQRERLRGQILLAETDADRQRLSLELFDLETKELREAQERIIASETRTEAEKALAQIALNQINANAPIQRENVKRQTETPVQQYMRELSKTPDQINEAIDRIRIDGLNALNDGLVDAIMGAKSLGEVFSNVAKQILADLLRIAIQQTIIKPLANALFGAGGLSLPGFANGTNFAPGGMALVGERGPELVNLPRGSRVNTAGQTAAMLRGAGQTVHSPTFVFPGITNAREAREAAGQAARRYREGLNGPLRRAG